MLAIGSGSTKTTKNPALTFTSAPLYWREPTTLSTPTSRNGEKAISRQQVGLAWAVPLHPYARCSDKDGAVSRLSPNKAQRERPSASAWISSYHSRPKTYRLTFGHRPTVAFPTPPLS